MKKSILSVSLLAACAAFAESWPTPVKEMKPWAYNWWMGSAVDDAGLKLQVEEMAKVGMGGMHVIPIYSVKDNPKDKVLLSPEWMKAFSTAVNLAGEKGMGVDLTTGSGWCFGGPMLAPDDGAWMIEVNSKKLGDRKAGVQVLWKGKNAKGDKVTLSVRPTKQQVKRSGPGGHGPMMNPLSPSAMEAFLAPFITAFDAPGAAKPEHMYHDSYEYFGAGWSRELPEAFRHYRGYDLADHYAELAGIGDPDTVARVKCDYRETISDMMVEDVFSKWQRWANSRGIATRNEAHGAPANWLDFYALADIPETEMFSCEKKDAQFPRADAKFMNSGDRDILISKFASSAAHVKHAGAERDPLVSSESCTWVTEHFCETPAAVKTFVDRLILSGVNHMFYHGMCYSPAEAKFPGWTFYATCEMNRFNPLWQTADSINAYITRVQSIAQTQAIDNDLLVYWPIQDYWMDKDGFERQMSVHACDWFNAQPIGAVSRELYRRGYAFDYISEKQLAKLASPEATGYKAILVPNARYMKPATFAHFIELAEAGYQVLFVGGYPKSVPGLMEITEGEHELERLARSAAVSGNVAVGDLDAVLKRAALKAEPFNPSAGLMYTRHIDRSNGAVSYFIANQLCDGGVKGWFKPASKTVSAAVMDPWTGVIEELEVKDGKVELDLPIGHSTILVCRPFETAAAAKFVPSESLELRLENAWTRTPVVGGPEFPSVRTGFLPMPWGGRKDQWPENAFSGTMRYETTVNLVGGYAGRAELDLGKAAAGAKVFVNGLEVGAAIMPPWRVSFSGELLVPGDNTIAVEVTSTGANHLKWLDTAKPYEWQIFTDINMVDIDYKKPFDASKWAYHEAGLYGPAVLRMQR